MVKTQGERIRELRGEKDISLREFARKLGLSAAFVSDVELGRRYPSEKVLTKIARLLGTSVEDLRSYDTRPPVEDIKRLASSDPAYGLALRRLIDKKVGPEELMKLADKKTKRRKK